MKAIERSIVLIGDLLPSRDMISEQKLINEKKLPPEKKIIILGEIVSFSIIVEEIELVEELSNQNSCFEWIVSNYILNWIRIHYLRLKKANPENYIFWNKDISEEDVKRVVNRLEACLEKLGKAPD